MRVFLIVLDGVGMGALPDAGRYGDAGANTLLHVADSVGRLPLPVMETLGLGNLLRAPGRAARELLVGPRAVGRVIARPFEGEPGNYRRTARRRDFSLAPFRPTVLDALVEARRRVITVGKVDELFAGHGVSDAIHTKDNAEGEEVLLDLVKRSGEGLVFANLVDFDTLHGHRNDAVGFARALERFDAKLGDLLARLRGDEMVWVTADHGNDPTTPR